MQAAGRNLTLAGLFLPWLIFGAGFAFDLQSPVQAAETAAESSQLSPSVLLNKSLSAYGGAESVQSLGRGFSVVGKEFEGADLATNGGAEPDATFRILRRANLWRLDHEKPAGGSFSQGFDGSFAWIKNGSSVADLSSESANALNWETLPPSLYLLETVRALADSDSGVEVTYGGKTSTHSLEVKSLKQENSSFTLFIEPLSFLLTAVEFKSGGKLVRLEFGEYRPALGTVYPYRQARLVDGKAAMLRQVEDVSLTKVPDSDFGRPGGSYKLARPVQLPFDYSQRELLVKGRINNGEELEFLFDTGASETIIDRRVAAENYLLKEGLANLTALGGAVATNVTTIGRLELGNLVVNDLDARSLDLSGQSRHLGRRLAGIIGTNLISRYVVAIDYGKSQITFYDADTFVRPADLIAVPFARRSAPVVKVRVGKEDVPMLVDTGAAYNNLPAAVALKYAGAASGHRVTEGTGLDGKPIKLGRVTIDGVSLGGRPVSRVDFTYTISKALAASTANNQGFFQTTNLGIVGNPLLENFIVYIDYKFQRMLLKSSGVVKLRSEIEQALKQGDDQLIQKRDFRLSENAYQRALLAASGGADKRNEARALGRLGNLKRMMAKDLNRPEHSKAAYDYFVKAQELSKRIGATEVEGRILADWSLLYLDNGQMDSAKQTMDRALQLAPQDAAVNVDCSVHLYKSQRFPEMQRYIEKALFLEPDNWQALWYQVKLSETFADMPKAVSTLKEILRFYPWSKPAQEKLSTLEGQMNALNQALAKQKEMQRSGK
ncbi:MAG TPA: aspartyl protease family protein [Candidatus Obscuribacter sp.]|nr:aspartyl protease family protein [Candidatus Obscuribacter sp.]